MPYFTKAVSYYSLSSAIMKSSPILPLRNLPILANPSRESNGSIGLKVTFLQYYQNSSFGLLTAPFNHSNLPSTTRILRPVLSPAIKKISGNIYRYSPQNCANGGPQVKGVDFYQSYSPFLEYPTIRLIVAIAAKYHLAICIVDITNALQNTLKDSSEG